MIDARGMRGRSWCGRRTRQMDVARLPTTPSRGRRNSVACTLGSPFAFRVHPPRLRLSRPRRSPIHQGRREGGWKGELHVEGSKSIFALYAASNADKFLPRGEKERKPRSPFVSSSHEIARGSRGASTLDLFPLKFGSLKGVEKESALAREPSRALSRGNGSGFHGINDFQGGVSVEIKL